MTNDRLVSFLYVLIRDHLTVGTLEKVLRQVDRADGYTLRTAEIFAVDMAARIEKRAERATREEPLEIAIGDRFEWTGLDYPSVNNGDVIRVTGGECPKWSVYNETQKRSKDSWLIKSPRWRRLPVAPVVPPVAIAIAIGDRFEWIGGINHPLFGYGDVVRTVEKIDGFWYVYNETQKRSVMGSCGMDPSCWRRLPAAPVPIAIGDRFEWIACDTHTVKNGDVVRVTGTDGNYRRVYNETQKLHVPGAFGMDQSCWRRLRAAAPPAAPADVSPIAIGDRFEWIAVGAGYTFKHGDVVRVTGSNGAYWNVYNETQGHHSGAWGMDPYCWRRLPAAPRSPAAEGMLVTDFGSLRAGDKIRKSNGMIAVLHSLSESTKYHPLPWWETRVIEGNAHANILDQREVTAGNIFLISRVTP